MWPQIPRDAALRQIRDQDQLERRAQLQWRGGHPGGVGAGEVAELVQHQGGPAGAEAPHDVQGEHEAAAAAGGPDLQQLSPISAPHPPPNYSSHQALLSPTPCPQPCPTPISLLFCLFFILLHLFLHFPQAPPPSDSLQHTQTHTQSRDARTCVHNSVFPSEYIQDS
ncbi:hypothetical protein AGOR_G00159500 [Albula goreensis]|uniref:Uncharacterized protein n=1 Tax=Albula goreensis TaxID=1534307 RepID=A0A8T3D5N6_9TELE|nr:hypothetical protein AGOR_G00159500 [Albula goreensis]